MPNCYLTFDDGPHSRTMGILDTLRSKGVKATFYMNFITMGKITPGKRGDEDRTFSGSESQYKIVKRVMEEGHAVGDHGLDHHPYQESQYKKNYAEQGTAAVKKDFIDNNTAFSQLFKKYGSTFPGFSSARLPGHGRTLKSTFVPMITNEVKLAHVGWDMEFAPTTIAKANMPWVGPRDGGTHEWQGIEGLSATTKELPGQNHIILFHDMHWTKGPDLNNLGKLIDVLLKNNFTMKSLKDLPNEHHDVQRAAK